MTFFALLSKEMRVHLRREQTAWLILINIVILGLLGWLVLSNSNNYNSQNGNGLSQAGLELYALLSQMQLFFLIFITPSFTASAINGEKEHQTYDMLACSRLSVYSLILGKLIAGLINSLILIAASVPLFSLVFFFGGVSPEQIMSALAVFVMTTLVIGSAGLLCSIIFGRTAVSIIVTYIFSLLWVFLPLLLYILLIASPDGARLLQAYPERSRLLFLWNPVVALVSTYPIPNFGFANSWVYFLGWLYSFGNGLTLDDTLVGTWHLAGWQFYSLLSLLIICIFLLVSAWALRLRPRRQRRQSTSDLPNSQEATATVQ